MHLHAKLVTGLLLLLGGISLSMVLTFRLYLLPHVQVIEEEKLNTDLTRAEQSIQRELSRLSVLAVDWGYWDDTYTYLENRNHHYEKSNLTSNLLSDLQVDLLTIFDSRGNEVQHLTSSKLTLADLTGSNIRGGLNAPEEQTVIQTRLGPMLISSSPIMPSEGYAASRGTLVFGRLLDSAFSAEQARITQLNLLFSMVNGSQAGGSRISFPDDNTAFAQRIMGLQNDGQHLSVSVTKPRPYYQEARRVVHFTLIIMTIIGATVSFVAYLFLKRTIVNPILLLKRQADHFGRSRQLQGFQPMSRNDELGELSSSFIQMAQQLAKSQGALERERARYLDASLTDPLTQLRNRRYMEQYFADSHADQTPEPVFIMMIDLDHFKAVNDTHGHDTGDHVLRELAVILQKISRENDLVVRYGGEEFMLVCRDAPETTACQMAERIRREVETFTFCAEQNPLKLTCSLGFFTCLAGTQATADDWQAMVKVADLALYAAKDGGRNTWVGLKVDTCSHSLHLPTQPQEVIRALHNKVMTSCCQCGDSSRIQWR